MNYVLCTVNYALTFSASYCLQPITYYLLPFSFFDILCNMPRKRKTSYKVDWQEAKDIKKKIVHLVKVLDLDWVETKRIFCYRSQYSQARAYARIWSLSRIWQLALETKPAYVIEVLSERFDKLPEKEKDKVLLHELTHIPKNFSGSLLPHTRRRRGRKSFHDKVEILFKQYLKLKI
jgi:predicted metallopeptidase